MSKLVQLVSRGARAVGNGFAAVGRGIASAASATGNFLSRHWAATAAVVLGLIAFAAVTAALIFFWPATIAAIAGLSVTLPFVGAVAPFAFLSALSIPAAAAVVGAFAFAATIVASAVVNVFAAAYNALDRFFNPTKTNGGKKGPKVGNDEDFEESATHLKGLGGRKGHKNERDLEDTHGHGFDLRRGGQKGRVVEEEEQLLADSQQSLSNSH
ncbi:hypothetical protein BN59_00594 [Legionella massiliensis]|uniref:Uncharacterized protein n=1 Tax=Legionella massiliensis TaxID=1034943 RepID=A0A078KTN5_9GAMM|nr:hypothetical protein [Legionella massiliensis]CDZ76327.1 hypothetical protein BN59_00594 [Legionella massiliensis]CEE12065.1 hypothetical protein BN1094_00594 [Legionella massiliensis]